MNEHQGWWSVKNSKGHIWKICLLHQDTLFYSCLVSAMTVDINWHCVSVHVVRNKIHSFRQIYIRALWPLVTWTPEIVGSNFDGGMRVRFPCVSVFWCSVSVEVLFLVVQFSGVSRQVFKQSWFQTYSAAGDKSERNCLIPACGRNCMTHRQALRDIFSIRV